jgi:hypothetical protein
VVLYISRLVRSAWTKVWSMKRAYGANTVWLEVMSSMVPVSVAVEVKLINQHVIVSNRSTIDKIKYAEYESRCPDMIIHSRKSSTVTFLSWYPCDITQQTQRTHDSLSPLFLTLPLTYCTALSHFASFSALFTMCFHLFTSSWLSDFYILSFLFWSYNSAVISCFLTNLVYLFSFLCL